MLAETEIRSTTTDAEQAAQQALRQVEPQEALPANEGGTASRPAYDADEVFAAQMKRLGIIKVCILSVSLLAAVHRAIAFKTAENDLRVSISAIQRDWPEGSVRQALRADGDAMDAEWLAAWEASKEAAEQVLLAPADGYDDILYRSEAYLCLIGTTMSPEAGSDDPEIELAAMRSIKEAVEERATYRPISEDAGAEFGNFTRAERALNEALADAESLTEVVRKGGQIDKGLAEEAERKITRLDIEHRAAATKALFCEPENLGDLIIHLGIIVDAITGADVTTYGARDHHIKAKSPTFDALRARDPDAIRAAFALLGSAIATIRDRDLPTDWRELWQSTHLVHPNARDALWTAYNAGVNPQTLQRIRLTGLPAHLVPELVFADSDKMVVVHPHEYRRGPSQ